MSVVARGILHSILCETRGRPAMKTSSLRFWDYNNMLFIIERARETERARERERISLLFASCISVCLKTLKKEIKVKPKYPKYPTSTHR